jgi:hypothetical protein
VNDVRVFINYRRSDTRHVAGRLRDRIDARFGDESVFVDVESIEPGRDYVTAIDGAVSSCLVMLVLIGEEWLTPDDRGVRRIDDPNDRLRLEIEAGLRHRTVVIPVLVDAATMPKSRDLPESVVPLSRHQAVRLRHDSFGSDSEHLLDVIARIATEPGAEVTATPTVPARKRTSNGDGGGSADVARWVALGLLVLVLLLQLASVSAVRDSIFASRPSLPSDDVWATTVWLLSALPVAVAALLVLRRSRPGTAVGCVVAALLWLLTSLVLVASRQDSPSLGPHLLVLAALLAALVALLVAEPEVVAAGNGAAGSRSLALLLLVAAVVLRCLAPRIAEAVTASTVSTDVAPLLTSDTFWLSLLVPLLVCLPALGSRSPAGAQALVTVAGLLVLYPLVIRCLTFSSEAASDGAAQVVVADVVFLLGSACMLWSVRAAQRRVLLVAPMV